MALLLSEVTTPIQENSNPVEMHQQAHIIEPASNVKNGAKPKFQTKICDHWRRSGNCSYGDSCWYAHGEDDLRKLTVYRNNRPVDDKPTGEGDRNGTFGNMYRSASMAKEDPSKSTKNPDEFKAPLPPKRLTTNVKGLTVNIPQNIAYKEQSVNASMPLSPAQERWISMSNNAVPTSVADKSNEMISSSSSTTVRNGFENELDKRISGEIIGDRRAGPGKFFRDDDAEDYGFLSPNPFAYPPPPIFPNGNSSHGASMNTHHRSYSRGPHLRNFPGPQFGGIPSHPTVVPNVQEQVRVSRPVNINGGCNDRHFAAQKSVSNPRTLREIPPMNAFNGSQPQLSQAYWNVAGELCQRQKDIETSGIRGAVEQQNIQTRDPEVNRVLAKLKMKDLPYLRYILDRADRGSNERDVARPTWNELINNGSQPNMQPPPIPPQFHSNNTGFPSNVHNNVSECSCRSRPPKMSLDASLIPQSFPPSHPQPIPQHYAMNQTQNHHHHQQHQYILKPEQQQMFRYQQNLPLGVRATVEPELAAPPKIFESLLPSDENFSIWLDTKSKNETDSLIPPSDSIDHSISDASLLTKMEVLRSEKVPISDEDIESSRGTGRYVSNGKRTNSESSSPPVLSLMELLSSENLLDDPVEKPESTMFDFDTAKIAETMKSGSTLSGLSSEAGSTRKSKSPAFFLLDDKTPMFDESFKQSGLFTPSTVETPSFMEQCDFFAAAGTCPFGDACHFTHSVVQEQEPLETL